MKDKHNTYNEATKGRIEPPMQLFNEEDLEKAQPKLHKRLERHDRNIGDLKHVTLSTKKDLEVINHVISTNSRHIDSLQNDSGNYYQHLQELDSTVDKLTYSNIITAGALVTYIILDLFII